MEPKTPKPMTPFDSLTTPSCLYTLKLLLPYTPPSIQHFFAIYIKLQELNYTVQYFHGQEYTSGISQIFSDLKAYMTPEEQEQIENMEHMINMMTMIQNMPVSEEQDLTDLFSTMFSQETGSETDNNDQKGDVTHERMDGPSTNEGNRSDQTRID